MNTQQAKHTPGPWQTDAYGVVTGGPNALTSICETYAHAWAKRKASLPINKEEIAEWLERLHVESMANARLIASAPQLLEALQALVADGECYCADNVAVKSPCGHCQARAAIQAATQSGKGEV